MASKVNLIPTVAHWNKIIIVLSMYIMSIGTGGFVAYKPQPTNPYINADMMMLK